MKSESSGVRQCILSAVEVNNLGSIWEIEPVGWRLCGNPAEQKRDLPDGGEVNVPFGSDFDEFHVLSDIATT